MAAAGVGTALLGIAPGWINAGVAAGATVAAGIAEAGCAGCIGAEGEVWAPAVAGCAGAAAAGCAGC